MLFVLIIGCGREPIEVKQSAKKSGKAEMSDTDKFTRETYEFQTAGQRDPFMVLNSRGVMPTQPEIAGLDNLLDSDATFRLGGLIWNEPQPGSTGCQSVALIYTSDNKKWIAVNDKFVYPVDLIGYRVRIQADRVILTMPDGTTVELKPRRI